MKLKTNDIVTRFFSQFNVELIKAFYNTTTYRNGESVRPDEETLVAFDGEKVIGVFRLCRENGVCVLRGFNVSIEYQRKGVGSLMLKIFDEELKSMQCYLICKGGLNGFYLKAGFRPCEETTPEFLIERMKKYANKELNVLMRTAQ